jgi:hypothetical protein
MSEQKINKSDYTDRKGVVHDSIGENIRSDNNQLSVDFLNSMSEDERNMFPFFPFKKGKWVNVVDTITNGLHSVNKYLIGGSKLILRVDYKVKYAIVISSELDADYSGISYIIPRTTDTEKFTIIKFYNGLPETNLNNKKINMFFYVED